MVEKLLSVKSYDLKTDLGLLVLRVGANLCLFIKHGIEKIDPSSFREMAPTFPDPAHIGHVNSLIVALGSDAICSILLILGLCTRFAGAYIFVVLSVAWSFTHHFIFLGKGIEPKHGELIVMFITQSLALALLGPGKFSLDWLLWRRKEDVQAAPEPVAREKGLVV
jgi:putative oxidoreductase